MRRSWIVITSLVLFACGGSMDADAGTDAGAPTDAGHDAGMDASPPMDAGAPDAGPPDAGPPDSGAPDAGPPSIDELGGEVMAELTNFDAAVAAVPPEMRLEGVYLDLAAGQAGLNAIIGETGLMTLALSDATVRALADLRQCNLLIELFTRTQSALAETSEPTEMALHDELGTLISTLTAYREGLVRLYQERLSAGIVGPPVVVDPFYDNQSVRTTGAPLHLAFVVEGASASMETASFDIYCFSDDPVDVTIVQEDTGATLASGSGNGSLSLSVPVPFDTPTAVVATVMTTPSSGVWESCGASMTSRRNLRADPVAYDDSLGSPYSTALMAWNEAVSNADITVRDARDTGVIASSAAASVADQIAMLFDLIAPFVASDALPIPLETYQNAKRRLPYIAAMFDAMVASAPLAGPDADALRTALADLKSSAQDLMAAASPL